MQFFYPFNFLNSQKWQFFVGKHNYVGSFTLERKSFSRFTMRKWGDLQFALELGF